MKELYKFLNLTSNYGPKSKNGNIPYIPKGVVHDSIMTKLAEDDTKVSKPLLYSQNLYDPKSLAEIRSELALSNR